MNRQLADDVSHIDLELCIVELGLKRTFVFFFPSCRVSLLYHFAEQLQTSKNKHGSVNLISQDIINF